jgi:2-dehydropantoate 2-reductase
VKIAVLGPGGVGGLLAGVLADSGQDVTVVAHEATAQAIAQLGLRIDSVRFGKLTAHPRAVGLLEEPVDVLIVATKAGGMPDALQRIALAPAMVVPLLNGLDHMFLLRERFAAETVIAGSIRVEADRPEPGVVVHTSPFLLVSMASAHAAMQPSIAELADVLTAAGVPVKVGDSEPEVLWSKLVRLNALACTTSAYDKLLGEIRSTPELRADLVGCIEEACAAANAEGALGVSPEKAVQELERAHETLGSSMQRDIAAGRTPELDAIPGSVMRAAARHGLACPTIQRLSAMIALRAGIDPPTLT